METKINEYVEPKNVNKMMKELIKIQCELKAPKDKRNSFGNYNYRSCESILESVKPLLLANNCYLTLTDDVTEVGGRIYVRATATITNKDGLQVSTSAFARESEAKKGMDDSQITGTASSYARKYSLNGLFAIDDSKDADTDEYHKQTAYSTAKVDEFATALDEVRKSKDVTELNAVWNKYAKYQSVNTFVDLVKQVKTSLTSKN